MLALALQSEASSLRNIKFPGSSLPWGCPFYWVVTGSSSWVENVWQLIPSTILNRFQQELENSILVEPEKSTFSFSTTAGIETDATCPSQPTCVAHGTWCLPLRIRHSARPFAQWQPGSLQPQQHPISKLNARCQCYPRKHFLCSQWHRKVLSSETLSPLAVFNSGNTGYPKNVFIHFESS